MYDLVIRGATVVDGTGAPARLADVAVQGSRIAEVGAVSGTARRVIDASGAIVTPGWVDIHTHYDGQATWDSMIEPSSQHGVTSVVMGNCGVGFAPARPGSDAHDFLISLMEGVEDIPGAALHEGLSWEWQSIPEYLDAVDARPHVLDVGAQVPHAALRAYVMGERGGDHEAEPTADEIAEMSRLTEEALIAGALGFATSRTANHRSRTGEKIGSLTATKAELFGIGEALGRTGRGVFQFVTDFRDIEAELALMAELARQNGRALSVSLIQVDTQPDRWRDVLRRMEVLRDDGVNIKAQVPARAIGLLLSLEGSMNPFMLCPSYVAIASLPLAERVVVMRRPEVRAAILAEQGMTKGSALVKVVASAFDRLFQLGDPPDYEQPHGASIGAQASARGADPKEMVYDLLLERGGREMLYYPAGNYAGFSLDAAREMALHDLTLPGLSDGGAHVGVICDGSFPTYNLMHWVRDRRRGPRLPIELVVHRQTQKTAHHVGWNDRGVIAAGFKADLNVIDLDSLRLHPPRFVYDLPCSGRRLLQDVDGYIATVCSGVVTFEHGQHTGELPGRVVRGSRSAESARASTSA